MAGTPTGRGKRARPEHAHSGGRRVSRARVGRTSVVHHFREARVREAGISRIGWCDARVASTPRVSFTGVSFTGVGFTSVNVTSVNLAGISLTGVAVPPRARVVVRRAMLEGLT